MDFSFSPLPQCAVTRGWYKLEPEYGEEISPAGHTLMIQEEVGLVFDFFLEAIDALRSLNHPLRNLTF